MEADQAFREKTGIKLMRFMLATVALSSMSVLMFSIVIPEIARELELSLAQVSWLSSGYILVYAFGTVTYGKLADRFQLKNILTFGLILFATGSLIGLFSPSFAAALAGRLIQAAGASVVPAMAMLIPVRYFAPERRASAMSMTAIGLALGNVLGPVVSAMIVSFAGWRWLFVPPMLLLVLLPFFRKYLDLPASAPSARFDGWGGALLLAAMSLLLLGITYGSWELIVLGVLTLPAFYLRIRYSRHPFIQPQLFRNAGYRTGLLMTILVAGIANGLFYLSPIMFAGVYEMKAEWIGYALVPAAFASALLGKKGGKLADRKGSFALYSLAAGLMIACFVLLSVSVGEIGMWFIPFILILGNVGQTFMQVAIANAVSTTLPPDQVGVGMGLFSMSNFIALGMSTGLYSLLVEGGALGWSLLHDDPLSSMFGNLYLILALMHALLLGYYYRSQVKRKTLSSVVLK
ncbi:MFS transporter [Cohnella hongkongensis]|uniref:MFS transporter n=1 Tax=Cohnella hongkongensis TaxID=178337 RepID=A0ABV9FJA8_9BACL